MRGAWLVLPFAGLEILLVGLAFHIVGWHDGDYEVLRIEDEMFKWELKTGDQISSLSGNCRWLQVSSWTTGYLLNVSLRYSGSSAAIGLLASDEQRRDLCILLDQVLKRR
jgi:uncharacterized membrane protein